MRLLRRLSPREVSSIEVTPDELRLWARHGYLREADLLCAPEEGTLRVAEVPALAPRSNVPEVALAAGLAVTAGVLARLGGLAGAVAAVPLLALFQAWVMRGSRRARHPVGLLPRRPADVARFERAALVAELRPAARKSARLAALFAAAAIPVAAPLLLAALTVRALRRRFGARRPGSPIQNGAGHLSG